MDEEEKRKKEEEKRVKEMSEKINKALDSIKADISKKADIEVLESRFDIVEEKLETIVGTEDFEKQQGQLDEISTQLKQLGELQTKGEKSFDEQLEKQLKSDEFKKGAKSLKGNAKGSVSFELPLLKETVPGAGTYGLITTDVNSGTIEAQVEPGVAAAPWRLNPIWAAIQKGTISPGKDQIAWWEETTRTDAAAMFTEETKIDAQSGKTWTKQTMDIMMIADYVKVSRSAMEDFIEMRSEIMDLLNNGIPRKRETQLYSGAGTTIYLKGLTQYAKTFAKPANYDKVPQANIADVINAAVLQCANGNISDTEKKGYLTNVALVNPGTITNLTGIKDPTTGIYVTPPFVSKDGMNIAGARLIPSLDVGNDTFIVGDFSQAKAFIKRNMRISWHFENEADVLRDLVLVFASMRIAGIRIKAPAEYGFVTGTFTASKLLIESLEA